MVILAHVFCDRIAWFIAAGDQMLSRGVAGNFDELRGEQVRAGVAEVALFGYIRAEEIAAAMSRHDGWRRASANELAVLQNFFEQASREIAKSKDGEAAEDL